MALPKWQEDIRILEQREKRRPTIQKEVVIYKEYELSLEETMWVDFSSYFPQREVVEEMRVSVSLDPTPDVGLEESLSVSVSVDPSPEVGLEESLSISVNVTTP